MNTELSRCAVSSDDSRNSARNVSGGRKSDGLMKRARGYLPAWAPVLELAIVRSLNANGQLRHK